MTEEELVDSLTGVIVMADIIKQPEVRKAARAGFMDLCGLVIALRRRVELLEARKIPQYRGAWTADHQYQEADCCSLGGSMWIAKRATTERPSTNGADWILAVRAGRDGKPR